MNTNRWQFFWPALGIGALVVCPIVSFVQNIVTFGFGFSGSNAISINHLDTILLWSGFRALVITFACVASRGRPWHCALTAAAVIFALRASEFYSFVNNSLYSPKFLQGMVGIGVVDTIGIALSGYFIAVLAAIWKQHYPREVVN